MASEDQVLQGMPDEGHARGSLPDHDDEHLAPSAAGWSTDLVVPVSPWGCPQPLTPLAKDICGEIERTSPVLISNYTQLHTGFTAKSFSPCS